MRKLLTLSLSLFSFLSHSQSQLFITSKNGLQNDTVNHIVSDQNESLWIATINGLSEFELDGTLNVISQTNGMNISDVDVHPSSGVWMVEDSLVAQYFNNQLTVYPMTSTVNSWMPNEIEVLRNGDVYCLFGGVLY